ncbi:MAG: hypothetical protein V1719_00790 [Patescibacteria group bacterium]
MMDRNNNMDTVNALASALTRVKDDIENKDGSDALGIISRALEGLETAKCPKCKGEGYYDVSMGFYRGNMESVGCEECNHTGERYKKTGDKWVETKL